MTTVVARALKTPDRHTGCGKKEQPVRRSPMRNAARTRRARFVVPLPPSPAAPTQATPAELSCPVLNTPAIPADTLSAGRPHKTAHAPRQRLAQAGASSPRPRRGSTVSIPHAGSTYSSLWQALSGTSHRQASVTPTCHAIVRSTTAEGVTHRCGLQPHSFGKASQDRSASP